MKSKYYVMDDVKNIIKLYMARRAVSPQDLCGALNIGQATLYAYFRNPDMWRVGLLYKAYDYLGVPDDERIINIK